jgi:hypothetical protein
MALLASGRDMKFALPAVFNRFTRPSGNAAVPAAAGKTPAIPMARSFSDGV